MTAINPATVALADVGSVCAEGCCRAQVDYGLPVNGDDTYVRPMYELIPFDEGWGDAASWPDPHPWHDLDGDKWRHL